MLILFCALSFYQTNPFKMKADQIVLAVLYVILMIVLIYVYYKWFKKNGPGWLLNSDTDTEDVDLEDPSSSIDTTT